MIKNCEEFIEVIVLVILVVVVFVLHEGFSILREGFSTTRRGSGELSTVNGKERKVTLWSVEWCPYCKNMKPVWERVKKSISRTGVTFVEIDGDKVKSPEIEGYPTIIMEYNGKKYKYNGGPNYTTLRNWILSPNPAS